jgi:rhodanese-related sulfurtransferase
VRINYQHVLAAWVIIFLHAFPLAAQEFTASNLIDSTSLASYIKKHKGLVLDVRMAGDCADNPVLKIVSDRISFDFGPDTPDGRKMAHDMFMQKILASRRLVEARKTGTIVLVFCCAGIRSEHAAALLAKHGFKVAHAASGSKESPLAK